jgi:hypothetical protein
MASQQKQQPLQNANKPNDPTSAIADWLTTRKVNGGTAEIKVIKPEMLQYLPQAKPYKGNEHECKFF